MSTTEDAQLKFSATELGLALLGWTRKGTSPGIGLVSFRLGPGHPPGAGPTA